MVGISDHGSGKTFREAVPAFQKMGHSSTLLTGEQGKTGCGSGCGSGDQKIFKVACSLKTKGKYISNALQEKAGAMWWLMSGDGINDS